MNVLFISAEVDPFAKVGGLADVVGSLPKALRRAGVDARVLMPDYGFIDKARYNVRFLFAFDFDRSNGTVHIEIFTTEYNDVPIYFMRGLPYFGTESGVYAGWDWDVPRFTFFSQAAIAVVNIMRDSLDYAPDILHVHDWHTGLIPFLVDQARATDSAWATVGTMFTIHNMAYQGNYVGGFMFEAGVPGRDHPALVRYEATDNLLGMALAYSDVITTVSPRYAVEIQFTPQGYGLETLLRTRMLDLYGILNGMDVDLWNPATDPRIIAHFDAETLHTIRPANKRQLQIDTGLDVRDDVLLIGIVSRLVWQKGIDIAVPAVRQLLSEADVQFVVLGTGEPENEAELRTLQEQFPSKARALIGFNAAVAQRIYAGSDLFLMPSRYEPCGVGQMLAMRYGSLPLVRETGGLADTVISYDNADAQQGTGFSFVDETAGAVLGTLRWAVTTYYERPAAWRRMQERGMRTDFSWTKSAVEYLALYEQIAARRALLIAQT